MRISFSDTRGVANWALAGLVGGALYQLGFIWAKQRTNVQDLSPPTEALWEDQEMFALFCQLQEFRDIAPLAFRRAVDEADKLVFLHCQLKSNTIAPVLADRANAFLHFKMCTKYLESFFVTAQHHKTARVPVEVHRLYMLIFDLMENHWNAVLHLTQKIKLV